MKKKIIVFLSVFTVMIGFVITLNAASVVTIIAPSQVEVGAKVSIRVKNNSNNHTFSGVLNISGSATATEYISLSAGETQTVQIDAKKLGLMSINMSQGLQVEIGPPYNSESVNPSARVNVVAKKPTNGGSSGGSGGSSGGGGGASKPQVPNVPKEPVVVKSRDNTLKSLSISEGTLSPAFSKDVKEYNVLLPKSVSSLDVSAVVNDDKSKVSNTGKHELKVGENVISLIVTPEEGSEGLYKINVYVEDDPKHALKLDDNDYSVIEHFVGADVPDSFSEVELNHNGEKVVGLYSELWKTNLLYLNDNENNRRFYIVEEGEDGLKIVSPFQLISIYSNDFLLMEVPTIEQVKLNMVYEDVQIGDQTFKGFKYSDESLKNYSVIFVRNMEGEDVYYQYEENDNVYQLYVPNIAVSEDEYNAIVAGYDEKVNFMTLTLIGVSILFVATGISFALYSKKTKKQLRHLIIKSEHEDLY